MCSENIKLIDQVKFSRSTAIKTGYYQNPLWDMPADREYFFNSACLIKSTMKKPPGLNRGAC
jgi:hypothetical protein